MAARGLEILEAMRLVRREGYDVVPLPAIARFNHVDMTARAAAPGGPHDRPLQVHALRADQPVPLRQPGLRGRGRAPAAARLQRLGQVDGDGAVVPLLFDGNLTASNLSTSDGQRSIAYHLLLDGLYPRRLGYSWAQFARIDETRRALGDARAGREGCRRTRATTRGSLVWDTPVMVDPHVMLVRPTRRRWRAARRRSCRTSSCYDSAEEYRARVNGLLFGFSERRYAGDAAS